VEKHISISLHHSKILYLFLPNNAQFFVTIFFKCFDDDTLCQVLCTNRCLIYRKSIDTNYLLFNMQLHKYQKKIFYSNNYRNNLFMEYCLKYKLQSNQSYMIFQGNSEIWCLIWPSKETVKYGVLYDLPRKQWNMVSYMTFQGNSEIWCLIWPSKETVKYGVLYDLPRKQWNMVTQYSWSLKTGLIYDMHCEGK
jgi:hypothetical protein